MDRKSFFTAASMAFALCAAAGNPLGESIGRQMSDPHLVEWNGRLYMFASHDHSPANRTFDMRDWRVWSSDDLLRWRLESVLKPEDTYLKRPFKSCWATFGAPFADGWRLYFSAGPEEIGVASAPTPAGPWRDALARPLVAKGDYPTQSRDPDILLDGDGAAYIVFGTFRYFIAKLSGDGLSLAEKARPVKIEGAFGPTGRGRRTTSRHSTSAADCTIFRGRASTQCPKTCTVPTATAARRSIRRTCRRSSGETG